MVSTDSPSSRHLRQLVKPVLFIMLSTAALAGLSNIPAIVKNLTSLSSLSTLTLIPYSSFFSSLIIGSKKILKFGFDAHENTVNKMTNLSNELQSKTTSLVVFNTRLNFFFSNQNHFFWHFRSVKQSDTKIAALHPCFGVREINYVLLF